MLLSAKWGWKYMNEAQIECYILKLIHQVDAKIHESFGGHHALVIQQSFGGRAKQGGNQCPVN